MKSSIAAPNFSNSAIWGARLLSGSAGTTTKAASSTAPAASKTTATTAVAKTTTTITASVPAATGKRGAAYNHAAYASVLSGYPKVAWAYDWDSNTDGTIPTAFNYVPMLWGADATHTGAWPTNVAKALAAGSDHLLAFNEPDLAAQSNLLPATAAAVYKQYMQPYAGQAKLGSPAVTNGGPPSGLTWLSQFMGNCTGCTVDFVAIHWYDSATNIAYFQNYVQSAYTQFNKPLWIVSRATCRRVICTMLTLSPHADRVWRLGHRRPDQRLLPDRPALARLSELRAALQLLLRRAKLPPQLRRHRPEQLRRHLCLDLIRPSSSQ